MGNHFHILVRMHTGSAYSDSQIKLRYADFFLWIGSPLFRGTRRLLSACLVDNRNSISYHIGIDQKKGVFMQTTISSKYQVVIPKPVRERLNLRPKQKLTVIEKDKMLILIPCTSLEALRGIAAGAKTEDYREKRIVFHDYR